MGVLPPNLLSASACALIESEKNKDGTVNKRVVGSLMMGVSIRKLMYVYRGDAVRLYGGAINGGDGAIYEKYVHSPVLISPSRPVLEHQLVKQGTSIILFLITFRITVAAYYVLDPSNEAPSND